MENLKLKHLDHYFKIDKKNKVVICKSTFIMFNGNELVATGIAQAKNEEFKEEIGKKLAKARAEKEAYVKYSEFLRTRIKKCSDRLYSYELSLDYTNKYLERQKAYIKKF